MNTLRFVHIVASCALSPCLTHSQVNLHEFAGVNTCFAAGADKGVAYGLYNAYFGGSARGRYICMAPSMGFQRAFTRDELVHCVEVREGD